MVEKIAIFYTDFDSDWVKPWNNFVEMAIQILQKGRLLEEDDKSPVEYSVFDILHNDFPNLSTITKENGYIGIYITGSKHDAFDTEIKEIVELRRILKIILTGNQYPPVTGVCFGHQVIAAALGCKVGRNPKGFEGGILPITLNKEGEKLFEGREILCLPELHNDVVFEVPKGYVSWGSTPKCENQGLYRCNKVITFQGHPEFVTDAAKCGLENMYKYSNECDRPSLKEHNSILQQCDSLPNDGPHVARYIWKLFRQMI